MGDETMGQRYDESPHGQDSGFEDFFTSFLGKKKKALMKKIDKIISLKASSAKLNQEQREMINREEEIRKQIQSYDDIRKLYITAMSKQENDQSSWMTPEAKLRGLLALYMTQGKVPADCHGAAELNKSYVEIFEASSLAESLRCGVRFTDNKTLNNDLSVVVTEGKTRGFKPHKVEAAPVAPTQQPAEYDGEYSNATKPGGVARPATSKGAKPVKENTHVGRFMQSDDDDEEERPVKNVRAPAPLAQSSKPAPVQTSKLALLPETMDEEAEHWIRMGPAEAAHRHERRGGRNAAPRRPPPFATQPPAPQAKPAEPVEVPVRETAAAQPGTQPADRRRQRDNNGQRNRRDRPPKQTGSEYVRKTEVL